MKAQRLFSYVRRATDDYNMINDGDKIAVGISGGKDSLTLLYALNGLKRFYPKKFDVVAITVDLDFAINIPNVYWRTINVALLPSLHIIPVMFRIKMLIITIAIIVIITNIRILPEKIPQAAPLLPPSR